MDAKITYRKTRSGNGVGVRPRCIRCAGAIRGTDTRRNPDLCADCDTAVAITADRWIARMMARRARA